MPSGHRMGLVVLIVAGLTIAGCGANQPPPPAQQPVPAPQASTPPSTPPPVAAAPDAESDLPPLPVTPFAPARPMEIVRSVFHFAARHPEVLSHVPCFCGCEQRGHHNNDDCFVAARDSHGRVTEWEPHGVG